MLDTQLPKAEDLKGLSPAELTGLATQMLTHIAAQSKHIDALDKRVGSQAQGIKWRDAKIESITFQLAKLRAWRFGAKTERMNAEQREIFEETFAADHASLQAQLAALQSSTPNGSPGAGAPEDMKRRQPKREALPAHLPRVDQRIEPEDTHCPTPECGKPAIAVAREGLPAPRRRPQLNGKYPGYSGGSTSSRLSIPPNLNNGLPYSNDRNR